MDEACEHEAKKNVEQRGLSVACLALDLGKTIVGNLSDAGGVDLARAIDAQHQHEFLPGPVPVGSQFSGRALLARLMRYAAVAAADRLFAVEAVALWMGSRSAIRARHRRQATTSAR